MKKVQVIDVTPKQLSKIQIPVQTSTYTPVPYNKLIDIAEDIVTANGFIVDSTRVQVRVDGSQMFAVMLLLKNNAKPEVKDFRRMLGLRSSYDKSLPNGLVFGTHVVACSNMMFCGDVKVFRRHTLNVFEELPSLFNGAFVEGLRQFKLDLQFFNILRERSISNYHGEAFLFYALLSGLLTAQNVKLVYAAWREHKEAATLYGLHNGFTAVWRDHLNPLQLPEKSQVLNQTFIEFFDL